MRGFFKIEPLYHQNGIMLSHKMVAFINPLQIKEIVIHKAYAAIHMTSDAHEAAWSIEIKRAMEIVEIMEVE